MKIVDADMALDGGTVTVRARKGRVMSQYEFDYSLPWDGRPRTISVTKLGRTRKVSIGSAEESDICLGIRECLESKYGVEAVRAALETSKLREQAWEEFSASQEGPIIDPNEFDDPYPVPFEGIWMWVFEFVEKAVQEGKIAKES